jgi:hypothetical protein
VRTLAEAGRLEEGNRLSHRPPLPVTPAKPSNPDNPGKEAHHDPEQQPPAPQPLPKHIRRYVEFNTIGLAQDIRLSGEMQVDHWLGGGVWIFNAN